MIPLPLRRRQRTISDLCRQMLSWFARRPTKRRRPHVFRFGQQLEPRLLLSGNPVANNDAFTIQYGSSGQINAPGVLANDTDPNHSQLMAHLVSGPSHTTFFQLNPDGSASFMLQSGYLGPDSFTYYDTDSMNMMSNTATVSLSVQYSVSAATDLTKQVAIDPLDTAVQILGSSGGAPATAHNLSLAYDSVAAQPDAVIQGMFQFNTNTPIPDTPTGTLTFNGVAQPATYVNLSGMNGTAHTFDLSYQVDTSALPTGRYPYTLTLNSPNMSAPATLSGAVNVVNDSAGPVGKGWDIPGLYHLYQNNVSGVPAGVLLTVGDGNGWYFTQGAGNSYTSPNGPYAFDTLTSVTGGGWQLVDKFGTTFNFDSAGELTSRVARTGEAVSYDWTSGLLTSIVDNFSRAVNLGYTSAQLSSIADFAGHVWSLAHVGANLTSVTEPDPGSGAPVWQYAYNGNYLSTVTNPDNDQTGYTLDSHHRLSGVSLPGGGSSSDTSEQSLAYGGPTQSGAPNILPSSSVETTSTDAMSNTSAAQTDAFGDPLYYQDAYGNVTTWQRDANGLVTKLTEPPPVSGAATPVTNYSYDTLGNETSATGAHPSYGTYVFNAYSEWTSFTDSQNHVWTQVFDTHGNLESTTDPLQNTVSYTNDSLGYPLTMTQPAPNNAVGTVTTTYTRDAYERLTKTTWPDATFRAFAYDTLDHQTSVTDENNHTTVTNLDALGRVVSVVDALNCTVATTYDKDGLVLTTQDEMGNVTTNVWNARSELVQQTLPDPDGSGPLPAPVWGWTYDANGDKLTQTDPMNRVTSWTWDKLGRNTLETLPDPDGAGPLTSPAMTIGYDNLSRKVSEKDPLGNTTTWAYANTDTSQLTSMTLPDPDGSGSLTSPVWTYSYDTLGRRYQTDDPMGHLQTTSFDADGHTASVLDNLGHGPTYAYGHGGELLTTTDALSHSTSDAYDSRYRLIQTTAADGGVTSITLDAAGNRTALVDPANNRTTWVMDALNRDTSETTTLGTTATTYDASSDVTSIQDADGRVRDFAFDNLHRQTAEQWMDGATVVRTIATDYDADSEVTGMFDPDSDYNFGLNNLGQTITIDNAGTPNLPHVVLTDGYDAAGDRTSLSATINGTADFLNSYAFDADQRLNLIQQQEQNGGNLIAPKEMDFAYNALGQFTSTADYNAIGGPRQDVATGTDSYDTADRLTGLNYTANGGNTSIDAYTWGYDNGDRITTMTSTVDGTANYGYDSVNELTTASYTGANQPPNAVYSFDKNGNRNMAGYSTGAANLVASDGTFNYQYDADGNRTVRTRISNAQASDYQTKDFYDYRNRLTDEEYYNNSGTLTKHVHYVYDTLDHQIGEQIDDTGGGTYDQTERFALDGGQPVEQFDVNGYMTARNLVAPMATGVDAVMAQEAITTPGQSGAVVWSLPDNLGTPHDVVGNSGAVVDHVITDSFGQTTSQTNAAAQPWTGFAGGHTDTDTGTVVNGERRYDASTGGWTTKDPIDLLGGDPNTGRYAGNDPTNAVDPTGLLSVSTSWANINGRLRATMTGIADDGTTTSSYVETLLDSTAPMHCVANANFITGTGPTSSWLDNYANAFNSAFGSGYSNNLGNAIYAHTPFMTTSSWANATDGQLLIGTAGVATVAVVGAVYGAPMLATAGTTAWTTISSATVTVPIPWIGFSSTVTGGAIGSMGIAAGVTPYAVSGGTVAVVAGLSPFVYMAAQGPGDEINPAEDTVLEGGDDTILDLGGPSGGGGTGGSSGGGGGGGSGSGGGSGFGPGGWTPPPPTNTYPLPPGFLSPG